MPSSLLHPSLHNPSFQSRPQSLRHSSTSTPPSTSQPTIPLPIASTPSNPSPHNPFRARSSPSSSPQSPNPPSTHHNSALPPGTQPSRYRATKPWPPTFSTLPPTYQFHLERKYRRRTQLKYARPTWTKITKIVQWGGVSFVLVYGVLFMDWGYELGEGRRGGEPDGKGTWRPGGKQEPFKEIREGFWGFVGSLSSGPERGKRRETADPAKANE
jgi:hypothetical protein